MLLPLGLSCWRTLQACCWLLITMKELLLCRSVWMGMEGVSSLSLMLMFSSWTYSECLQSGPHLGYFHLLQAEDAAVLVDKLPWALCPLWVAKVDLPQSFSGWWCQIDAVIVFKAKATCTFNLHKYFTFWLCVSLQNQHWHFYCCCRSFLWLFAASSFLTESHVAIRKIF